ncbi:MAG: hypothetical protein JWO36_1210 [Myxococcales bacterium]|nr:hypothetical protein [Myxococcales bacterium]
MTAPLARLVRSRGIAAAGLVALAIGLWWRLADPTEHIAATPGSPQRTMSPELAGVLARTRAIAAAPLPAVHDGMVRISGSVVDQISHDAVAGVEVVFRSSLGETTTIATSTGTYSIELPPGAYRAFVRDDSVLSIGHADRVRVASGPRADTAGVPDEALMPLVNASADTEHVELSVLHGGSISGHVSDGNGRPIAHAVVRARGHGLRPALGTDIAETDDQGRFELRVAPGQYALEASHAAFAGLQEPQALEVDPGSKLVTRLTMTAGCIISGRVVRADGTPAGDGAIERQYGDLDTEFGPAGRIDPDGTFRWVTNEEGDVTLRVWPWKSPPSPFRRFTCHDGARFSEIVFQLPTRSPTISGVLVDAAGTPVPFAYLDLEPLDPGGQGQQERTDADGRWQVYDMPEGNYHVEGQVPGRGVLDEKLVVPNKDVRLQLHGVGRIEGTTTDLADGSFEAVFEACTGISSISHEPRLVTVTGGRFAIDDAPACDLQLSATWHGRRTKLSADVVANETTEIELAIGSPRPKTIHGVVRDRESRPIPDAVVRTIGTDDDTEAHTVRTDGAGRYTMRAYSGAQIVATGGRLAGLALVGRANVDDEEVDVMVDIADTY